MRDLLRSRRVPRLLALLALALTTAACAPIVVTEGTARAEVRLEARPAAGFLVVRVPSSRPRAGVEVRRDGGRAFRIPPGHYPPPGACRVWRPGVPPGQQDPPGSCDDLEHRVPRGAYLVYG